MNETKVNSIKVEPVVTSSKDETKRKGYDIFPVKNWITYICARKGSGKSSLINSIIEKTTNKQTTIYLFVSTYKVDPTWIKIIEDLTDKGYTIHAFDAIFEGRGKNGINNLEPIVKQLNSGQVESSREAPPNLIEKPAAKKQQMMDRFGLPCKPINLFGANILPAPAFEQTSTIAAPNISEHSRRSKKKKSNAASNLFIFDDIANQLQNPSVTALLKIHRHSDSNVICSSQSLNDLALSALYQINFFIAFKGLSEAKLEECWRKLDISIPFDVFLAAYKHATSEKYDFFYLNTRSDEMRRNFNFLLTNKNESNSQ
jgi:ABC-type cobalamin/Fe3+-siderophores transport system ATPase subunit